MGVIEANAKDSMTVECAPVRKARDPMETNGHKVTRVCGNELRLEKRYVIALDERVVINHDKLSLEQRYVLNDGTNNSSSVNFLDSTVADEVPTIAIEDDESSSTSRDCYESNNVVEVDA